MRRRNFLALSAALGAGLALPAGRAEAGDAQRIDVHHHVYPPFYLERERTQILRLISTDPKAVLGWTPQRAVEEMDANGVATAIVSLVPGVWFGSVDEGRLLARAYHDYAARLMVDHPDRFGFFAALPLPDIDGSLQEMAHALDVLKADGVVLMTSYGDKWPGNPLYDPVFKELNRRKAVVFIHPTAPYCCTGLIPGVAPAATEFLFDTTRAITSLLANGTFGRYPEIRFIFAHAGGATTVLADRIDAYFARKPEFKERLPHGALYELKRLHYDVTSSVNPRAISALASLVPVRQMLFGSDYPILPIATTAGALDAYDMPDAAKQMINRDNALALFPRLKT